MALSSSLGHHKKQALSVLVQYRALDLMAPTSDDVARVARLKKRDARAALEALTVDGVVRPVVMGGKSSQARWKLEDRGQSHG